MKNETPMTFDTDSPSCFSHPGGKCCPLHKLIFLSTHSVDDLSSLFPSSSSFSSPSGFSITYFSLDSSLFSPFPSVTCSCSVSSLLSGYWFVSLRILLFLLWRKIPISLATHCQNALSHFRANWKRIRLMDFHTQVVCVVSSLAALTQSSPLDRRPSSWCLGTHNLSYYSWWLSFRRLLCCCAVSSLTWAPRIDSDCVL